MQRQNNRNDQRVGGGRKKIAVIIGAEPWEDLPRRL